MNNKIITTLLILLIGINIYQFTRKEKIVYINTAQVFDKFKLTESLRQEYTKVEMIRINQLDSLMMEITMLRKELPGNAELIHSKEKQYLLKQQEFQQQNEDLKTQLDTKIWTQLNQYIKDYGEANNMRFIFGSSGDGNLMYARENDNCTEAMIQYVNKRYEGHE